MSSFTRHSRTRLALFWTVFGVAALATVASVWMLHVTVSAGLREQEARVLHDETARARAQVSAFSDRIRRSMIGELAGFHADGLTRALRRWDDNQPRILGTFEWHPTRGLHVTAEGAPSTPGAGALTGLWDGVFAWRAQHPDALESGARTSGEWRVWHVRTLDNPALPARDMRYQAENLDVLAYDGHTVDPWAGWAVRTGDPSAPCVLWYRPGPDAPVRGCFVDAVALVDDLRAEFSDTELVRVEIGRHAPGDVPEAGALEDFPALALRVSAGTVLAARQSRVHLTIVAVALLAGLFVLAAAMLGIYSRREARDAERKTTFVSQVSHELRTPLTSIRMFADMLAAPGLSEEKRLKFAGTISRESQRLGGLIERLLAFNALARGKAAVAVTTVDVGAVVRETIEEQSGALSEAGMRLEAHVPEGEWMATTDRNAVKQALLNLLDNAAKYARDGGLVVVALERRAGRIVVRVGDRGPGISGRERAQIFEPFVQGGDRGLTTKAPGLGLGLSIARGLLRSAGGDLTLGYAEAGCTFEISVREK